MTRRCNITVTVIIILVTNIMEYSYQKYYYIFAFYFSINICFLYRLYLDDIHHNIIYDTKIWNTVTIKSAAVYDKTDALL